MNAADGIEADEGENLIAEAQHFAFVDALNVLFGGASDFHDGGKRNGEEAAADAEQQRLNAGESERDAEKKRGALPFFAVDVDGALEAIEDGATTSMPTPRPETSVISAAVLKPGSR